jgi:hypothetical protein
VNKFNEREKNYLRLTLFQCLRSQPFEPFFKIMTTIVALLTGDKIRREQFCYLFSKSNVAYLIDSTYTHLRLKDCDATKSLGGIVAY